MSEGQKFVVIFGPPAVGKMTVGQELAKLTGFKLFHNHLAIEAVLPVFDFSSPQYRTLVAEFRSRIFEEVSRSDLCGLIFTFVWPLNYDSNLELVSSWRDRFLASGTSVYFVELEASLEERLRRNRTENRLAHKSSKRDLELSERILLLNEGNWDMNTRTTLPFPFPDPYLRIDNTNLSPQAAALLIQQYFGW